jgi:hypothetical protein
MEFHNTHPRKNNAALQASHSNSFDNDNEFFTKLVTFFTRKLALDIIRMFIFQQVQCHFASFSAVSRAPYLHLEL